MQFNSEVNAYAEKRYRSREKRIIWYRVLSILMCVTVFFTTYALILPALTFDADTAATCGMVSHKHSSACYAEDGSLICGLPEHEHDMACFKPRLEVNKYGCGYAYEHTHGEDCYYNGKLVCTLVEHTHTDACAIQTVKVRRITLGASPETPFDINTGLVQAADNDWQVLDNSIYKGNGETKKTASDGENDNINDVRILRKIVPTDEENIFYVYLSIDRRTSMSTLLTQSCFYFREANTESEVGTLFRSQSSAKVKDDHIVYTEDSEVQGKNDITMTVHVVDNYTYTKNGNKYIFNPTGIIFTYTATRSSDQSQCSNGTVFMNPPGTDYFYDMMSPVNFHEDTTQGEGYDLEIYIKKSELGNLDFPFYETILDNVNEEIEDDYEMLEVVYCDGTYDQDCDSNMLQWAPAVNPDVKSTVSASSSDVLSGWDCNVSQLVYKVRLKTEENGFHSCADNMNSIVGDDETYALDDPAENSTLLEYHKELLPGADEPELIIGYTDGVSNNTMTAEFQRLYTRGLLYDLWFMKTDANGNPLQDAEFKILDKNHNPFKDPADPTKDLVTYSDANGVVEFIGLPGGEVSGIYYVQESNPPLFYELPSTAEWNTYGLTYTGNKNKFTPDDLRNHPENMRLSAYSGTAVPWTIVNTREPGQKVQFVKLDPSGNTLPGAVFDLYFSDGNGEILESPVPGKTGQTSGSDGLFGGPMEYSYGTYYLKETQSPRGYYRLTSPIRLVVDDGGVSAYIGDTALNVTKSGDLYTVSVENTLIPPEHTEQPDQYEQSYPEDTIEISKKIDYLANNDGFIGPQDLYRLYLTVDSLNEPIDLLLVVDQSTSMNLATDGSVAAEGTLTRQDYVKNFLDGEESDNSDGFIYKFLHANDDNSLAIITFGSDCDLDCTSPRRLLRNWTNAESAEDFESHLESIRDQQSTNYAAAFCAADAMFDDISGSTNKKIMVFLTDGEPTVAYKDGGMHTGYFDENDDPIIVGTGSSGIEFSFGSYILSMFTISKLSPLYNPVPTYHLYDDALNEFNSTYFSTLYEGIASFPEIIDFKNIVISGVPGCNDYPFGEIYDITAFRNFCSSYIGDVGSGFTDEEGFCEWLLGDGTNDGHLVTAGDVYDLYWLTESAFKEFADSNPEVITFPIAFLPDPERTLNSVDVNGNNRLAYEVLKYMSGEGNDFISATTGEALSDKLNELFALNDLSFYDTLSNDVVLADDAGLKITIEYNGSTIVLYENGEFTDSASDYIDTTATCLAANRLDVVFAEGVHFYGDFKCTAEFNVRPTSSAYLKFLENGYDAAGDADTDYDTTNPTSSTMPGFFSNDEAKVEWTRSGDTWTDEFPRPVVQVPEKTDLLLRKVDSVSDARLGGAEFDLYWECDSDFENAVAIPGLPGKYGIKLNTDVITSQSSNDTTVNDVLFGHYYLVEKKAPDGYIAIVSPIEFDLYMSGEITVSSNAAVASLDGDVIKVKNTVGSELPSTGSTGSGLYVGIGVLLMACALIAGLVLKRKSERNRQA